MVNQFFSWCFLLFIALTSLLFFPIALVIRLVTGPFDPRLVVLHQFSSFWAFFYVWCMPAWSVIIQGRQKLDWRKSVILVSNHQSQLDILVAFGLFYPFKWVSKRSVFNVPLIGWNMRLNRYIGLKRGDKQSIARMMDQCQAALEKGCSVFFFPEGTRSDDGRIKTFKTGAFVLAKKMERPIVPIAIDGTHKALPKYSMRLHEKQQIRMSVLDEIPVAEIRRHSPEILADMVRRQIAAHVGP